MKKINFTNATVTAQASVEIDAVSHDVTPAVIEGGTLPTPDNINQLQNNVEEAILNPVVESIKSENQFDKDDCVDYYYLDYNNGQPVADINMSYMKSYIPVKPNEKYTMSYSSSTIFVVYEYDSNKTFLRNKRQNTDATSFTVTISEDAYFVRLACGYGPKSGIVFTLGDTAVPYTPYKRYGYNSQESMGSIVVDDISCKNLFNKNNVLIGYFINLSGVQIASENMCMTNYYIEVNPNTEYTFSSNVVNYLYIAEYNSSKEFIKSTGIDGTDKEITITTDIGTKYVIASCSKHYLDGIQFEEGNTATNYSEYKGFGYTSGRNANGSWVKYDDGRMECYGVKTLTNFNLPYSYNGVYYNNTIITLPATFTDAKYTVVESCSALIGLPATNTGNKTTTTFDIAIKNDAQITFDSIDVNYIAIGRWK